MAVRERHVVCREVPARRRRGSRAFRVRFAVSVADGQAGPGTARGGAGRGAPGLAAIAVNPA
ncbi:MAG: hypothetical protein LBG27_13880 [Spirochaetaceae bacterium]|nr:hypothetical protein [Spirochaetaceae bacterium]